MNESGPETKQETLEDVAVLPEAVAAKPRLIDMLLQHTPPRKVTRENIGMFLRLADGNPFQRRVDFDSGTVEVAGVTGINNFQVFFGFRKETGEPVAIRIVHPDRLREEDAHLRFQREIRFLTQRNTDEPNYWPYLHETKKIAHPDLDRHWNYQVLAGLVDFLPGIPLDVLTGENPAITSNPSFVLAVAIQLVHAIEQYEEQGWVNRDLKPTNVMILRPSEDDLFVKLFDGSTLYEPNSSITSPGLVAGSPEYMSPEQARGEKLNGKSDIYAVGVIMYELLNQRCLFDGFSSMEVMVRHIQDPVPEMRPDIPFVLQAIIRCFLAKNSSNRPVSARQAREALVRCYRDLYPDDALAPYFSPALAISLS